MIIYQLFCVLKYLHSAKIIHRDIKPSNVLYDYKNEKLTLVDFGLSRQMNSIDTPIHMCFKDPNLTTIVATRNYRSPELSLGQGEYNGAVDIFSIGCVMYELFQTLQPLNENEKNLNIDQLFDSSFDSLIESNADNDDITSILTDSNEHLCQLRMLGIEDPYDLSFIKDDIIKKGFLSLPFTKKIDFKSKFNYLENDELKYGIDLMEKCLEFNPCARISAKDALDHPYLKSVRNIENEIEMNETIEFDYEEYKKLPEKEKINEIRKRIGYEIDKYY